MLRKMMQLQIIKDTAITTEMSSLCDQLYHLMMVTAHNFLPLIIFQQFRSQYTLWCQSDSCCLSQSMQNICNIPFSIFSSYRQNVF